MQTINFMDFGRQNNNCHILNDGFVFWKVNSEEEKMPVCIEGGNIKLNVHVIVIEGKMKMGCGSRVYSLTKNCFSNFIDNISLTVWDISRDIRAYVLLFATPFIVSLLKSPPPFPYQYVQKRKLYPVAVMSSQSIHTFAKRMDSIAEFFEDNTHHFQTEMLKCAVLMFMMDVANEYMRQENETSKSDNVGRKSILFKQFIRLLLDNVRKEHSVEWYASQLCVTPQYLNRAVKTTSHKTAYDHIRAMLIEAVIEELEHTENSISHIADAFHFSDLATMTKFFKRQTGKTPSEYRKEALLQHCRPKTS